MVVRSAKVANEQGENASRQAGDTDAAENAGVELALLEDGSSKGIAVHPPHHQPGSPATHPCRTNLRLDASATAASAAGALGDTMADYYVYLKSPFPCAHGGSTSGCTNFHDPVTGHAALR